MKRRLIKLIIRKPLLWILTKIEPILIRMHNSGDYEPNETNEVLLELRKLKRELQPFE